MVALSVNTGHSGALDMDVDEELPQLNLKDCAVKSMSKGQKKQLQHAADAGGTGRCSPMVDFEVGEDYPSAAQVVGAWLQDVPHGDIVGVTSCGAH